MLVDISKDIFVKDKEDKQIHKVTAMFFPLDSPSGKDLTIKNSNGIDEWRSIADVEVISNA